MPKTSPPTTKIRSSPMARLALDSRRKKLIGRTPHREIRRVQLAHARHLLSPTTLTRHAVAKKCGFRYLEYMGEAFKREVRMTPRAFRKIQFQHR
jgi:LacI family transcriptional regulator